MSKLRMISTSIWKKSRKFRQCDPLEKLLFLFLISNEDLELCGIYEISLDDVAHYSGIDGRTLPNMLTHLEEIGLVIYCDGWVMIPGYTKTQNKNNSKIRTGIDNSLGRVPEHIRRVMDESLKSHASVPCNSNSNSNSNSNLITSPQPVVDDEDPKVPDAQIPKRCATAQAILSEKFNMQLRMSDIALLEDLFDRVYPSVVYAQLHKLAGKTVESGKDPPEKPVHYLHSYMRNWSKRMTNDQMDAAKRKQQRVKPAPVPTCKCGGEVRTADDEAMCLACNAGWKLTDGKWEPLPNGGAGHGE